MQVTTANQAMNQVSSNAGLLAVICLTTYRLTARDISGLDIRAGPGFAHYTPDDNTPRQRMGQDGGNLSRVVFGDSAVS